MYQILIYENEKGESEIQNYIRSLRISTSKEDRIKSNKIRMYMQLLSKHGLSLGKPYIKHIDNQLWELRPLRDRFLFAVLPQDTLLLLCTFVKSTQKTPKHEIEKAKRLLKKYLERNDRNE